MYPSIIEEKANGLYRHSFEEELLQHFEVYCTGTISTENVNNLIMQLQYLNKQDPNREIVMYINSGGGEVNQGLALYDVMMAISNPIRTVCIGMAGSMGAILFTAGETRMILKHSCVMIHDPLIKGGSLGGSALTIKNTSDSIMRTREVLCQIIADRCGKSLEEIYEKTASDTYFYGQEAVDYNLADTVIDTFNNFN